MTEATIFERYEKKYLLDARQYTLLRRALETHFTLDAYGRHTILSTYYDTEDFAIIRHSLEKPAYKEKLRLRSYGVPGADTRVFLELKKKVGGIVYKRRIPLTMAAARDYNAGLAPLPPESGQIGREIDWFCSRYEGLAPRALIICEREAFFGKENENLRVTLDYDIRFRANRLDPGQGTAGTLLAPGLVLMEIKIPGAMPCFLAALLSALEIRPVSFSKYGTAYTHYLSKRAIPFDTFQGEQKHA